MSIKCSCGSIDCSVRLRLSRAYSGTGVDIEVDWEEKEENKSIVIELDANGIVQLIRELKSSLADLA